jgi:DNA-binding IclR family transcriptional regulator
MAEHRIPAVERAIEILDVMCGMGDAPSIKELAQRLDIPRSTVYRILNSFEAHGLAVRATDGTWAPGPRLLRYAQAVPRGVDLVTVAQPALDDLANALGATAKLSVLDGDAALVVATAESASTYSITTRVGRRFPLHAGAASKVLAAHLPDDRRRAWLEGPLARITDATITDPAVLGLMLDGIRALGVAIDRGEFVAGVGAIAAPVFDPAGVCVAAVSVPFLTTEAPVRVTAVEAAVRVAADRITASLGGPVRRAA